MMAVLKADGNTPANKDMFTMCEISPSRVSDPILSTATRIPSVPSTEVFFSPVMTLEIWHAFAKPKSKEIPPPPLSPFLGIAALS
jgi:hypothetical protein